MMLIYDFYQIGNKILAFRKRLGLTQAEVAEIAGLSDRTYADIERGTVNTRIETILRICDALHITPNEVLTEENPPLATKQEELFRRLEACPPKEQETALSLLQIYLNSLDK